jgi:membrane-bound lytic murein transglycosylase F
LKKLKINYLLVGVVALLLAIALWPSVPWFGKAENRLAEIQSRGVLRVSTIASPLTWYREKNKITGLDYELTQQFARYLGVKLEMKVRSTIDQLFDDLDSGKADILAAGLVYNNDRRQAYQAGPAYYAVSQQLVYRKGTLRPKSLEGITAQQMTLTPGLAALSELRKLREGQYPELSWHVDERQSSNELLRKVLDGDITYTIADSVAISMFQRIHPQLAVALDVTEEQPVTWFSPRDDDDSLSAALLDFFNGICSDGTLARLEEKYLGHVGTFDYVDTRSFLRAIDNVLPELQPLFEKYAQSIDWRLLAAISYQESHWNALATSPTGVRGMMMLTRNTAQSLGVEDRLDAEQSIRGGASYLQKMMSKVPETVPEEERIWYALAAYNMGYAHMLDARALTAKLKKNPDSWADVKQTLPLLSQKRYYTQTTYGYARGHEAHAYVENIRRYQQSLEGYLREKERQKAKSTQLARGYPAVTPGEVAIPDYGPFPFAPFFALAVGEKIHSTVPNTLAQESPR